MYFFFDIVLCVTLDQALKYKDVYWAGLVHWELFENAMVAKLQ